MEQLPQDASTHIRFFKNFINENPNGKKLDTYSSNEVISDELLNQVDTLLDTSLQYLYHCKTYQLPFICNFDLNNCVVTEEGKLIIGNNNPEFLEMNDRNLGEIIDKHIIEINNIKRKGRGLAKRRRFIERNFEGSFSESFE